MISYGKQFIDQSDIDAVVEVMKGDWLTQGPNVDIFENDLKHYFGTKYASAVSNGTAALHLAGMALGWEGNDYIITSPITFLATANSIEYSGANPIFVDIDKRTFTIDPDQVEDAIKELWRRHGSRSFDVIENISNDPKSAEKLSENIDYCLAEISVMKKHEFIYDSEDLLRRRTLIGQTVPRSQLEKDSGFAALIEHLKK